MLSTLDPPTAAAAPPHHEDAARTAEGLLALLVVALATRSIPAPRPRWRNPSKYRLRRWEKILAVMSPTRALIGKEIAALAGLKDDGQVRGDLSELSRQGKVRRVRGSWGYVLCDESSSPSPSASTTANQGD